MCFTANEFNNKFQYTPNATDPERDRFGDVIPDRRLLEIITEECLMELHNSTRKKRKVINFNRYFSIDRWTMPIKYAFNGAQCKLILLTRL